MWTSLADFLISVGSTQDVGYFSGEAVGLETLVQTIHQTVEELKGVVLLTKIYTIAPQSETNGRVISQLRNLSG